MIECGEDGGGLAEDCGIGCDFGVFGGLRGSISIVCDAEDTISCEITGGGSICDGLLM